MITFIDTFGDRVGVICRALRVAGVVFVTSRGYRAATCRVPSPRSVRDLVMVEVITSPHERNVAGCGVTKMRAALRRDGYDIGRGQTRWLMRLAGVRGVHPVNSPRAGRCSPPAPMLIG